MVIFPLCQIFRIETPTREHGLKVSQLSSQDLEPSSTYVVCVRSYSELSGHYSDCSAEKDFSTCEFGLFKEKICCKDT